MLNFPNFWKEKSRKNRFFLFLEKTNPQKIFFWKKC